MCVPYPRHSTGTDVGRAFGGGTDLIIQLYYREDDHRARILCKYPRNSGGIKYSCLPLNTLEFRRVESSLELCRRRTGSSKVDLWATLKFTTIERKHSMSIFDVQHLLNCAGMVIFYCTLLSLRSHDGGRPISNIPDHELDGEQEIFGG